MQAHVLGSKEVTEGGLVQSTLFELHLDEGDEDEESRPRYIGCLVYVPFTEGTGTTLYERLYPEGTQMGQASQDLLSQFERIHDSTADFYHSILND